MEMNGWVGGFYRVSVIISRLAYMNLLWMLFTLVGFGLFGIMPATVALFAVMRKWIIQNEEFPLFSTFWQCYKAEFVKANGFGLFFAFFGFVLYINFSLAAEQVIWMTVIRYVLLVLTIVFLMTFLLFFPVYVHVKSKGTHYIKSAFLLSIAYPQYMILMGIAIVAVQYVLMFLPGLIPFFTASLISYVMTKIASIIFKIVENKQPIQEDVNKEVSNEYA
ncbi:YesL family protein [Alkalihalobacillus sp. LMS39]|uniref:YesL family protein n=1 Tax=Alkalihalobacillus sp. LMS39 TaxID=2924032 RepID=UPI001FB5568D|nr:YesL family protein [Alkalihalobacillus sp. LMS39]UOE93045.1 YesL family protein [Alkalihalobacillus sp. LMS39]